MNCYSHVKENEAETREGSKLLKDHLHNIKKSTLDNLKIVNFSHVNQQELNDILVFTSIFHDLGKYSSYFQDYLLFGTDTGELRYHSDFSAIGAFNYLRNKQIFNEDLCFLTYFLIKNHHSNLTAFENLTDLSGRYDNNFKYNHENKLKEFQKKIEIINRELNLNNKFALADLSIPQERAFSKIIRNLTIRKPNLENYFLILYCFSLLIEADKMDASETDYYTIEKVNSGIVADYITKKQDLKINNDRTKVRELVSKKVDNININEGGLFTLTAPTGIGKTLTSMEFALKLKEKMELNGERTQIIYCLPFINIIEQVADEFEKLFAKENIKILKHHQFSDILSKAEEKEGQANFDKSLMELECWQGDIVITTFVQFFQTIIGNKNKLLKKFHHIANSIIILDEVQSINAEYWPLVGVTLHYLTKTLNSKILLMTATRPFIKEATNKFIEINQKHTTINSLPYSINEIPLLDNYQEFFEKFNRTKIIPVIKEEGYENEDFIDLFIQKRTNEQSALIVVNTIKRSIEIYDALKEHVDTGKLFYLSTNIIPARRRWVIKKVKSLLQKGEKVVLVSTQCIEAGVDLDFDMGFRDIAPADSIIQVAGRINRNNSDGKDLSPLYVINFKNDGKTIYGDISINSCIKVLNDNKNAEGFIEEPEYLELINSFFEDIISNGKKNFDESFKFIRGMERLNFNNPKDDKDFERPVNEFRLIKDTGYVDVFVEANWKATIIRNFYENEYLNQKDKKIRRPKYNEIKKLLNYFIISVPKRIVDEYCLTSLDEKRNLYILNYNEAENYYNNATGFTRGKKEDGILIF